MILKLRLGLRTRYAKIRAKWDKISLKRENQTCETRCIQKPKLPITDQSQQYKMKRYRKHDDQDVAYAVDGEDRKRVSITPLIDLLLKWSSKKPLYVSNISILIQSTIFCEFMIRIMHAHLSGHVFGICGISIPVNR